MEEAEDSDPQDYKSNRIVFDAKTSDNLPRGAGSRPAQFGADGAMAGREPAPRELISLDLVNYGAKRVSLREADYIIQHQLVVPGRHAVCHCRDVRRDDYVLAPPKGVAVEERR